jgi:hypothetical protein
MTITKVTDAGLDRTRIVTPLITNGDMQISQRATSQTGKTASGYYACDRWHINLTTLGTWTIAQESLTSGNAYNNGFIKSFRMDCTTADASPASGDSLYVRQKFEGQQLRRLKKGTSNAEKLTVAFWVKSNKTGTFTTAFYDHDNTRFVAQNYTISSADTWEKKVLNFPADTTGAMDNDNAVSLDLRWYLGAGSNATGGTQSTTWESFTAANALPSGHVNIADSTDNDWAITGVQLEIGEFDANTIPSFPFENFDTSLSKCQRYFASYGLSLDDGSSVSQYSDTMFRAPLYGDNTISSGECFALIPNPVEMRANPTFTAKYALNGSAADQSNTNWGPFTGNSNRRNICLQKTTNSMSGNQSVILLAFTTDAEL